ncbi:MAG TPA: QueT transporter family protein [candidate division Zixibacteria bacterium]
MKFSNKFIAQASIIAALYAALTILVFSPISYNPMQIRVAEVLTVLPYITPAAIPGLFIGCIAANLVSPAGIIDIIFGSLFTLLAAFLTYFVSKTKKPILAPLPPVLINAFGVSIYLHKLFQLSYLICVLSIAVGEVIACYVLGYPLLRLVLSNEKLKNIVKL